MLDRLVRDFAKQNFDILGKVESNLQVYMYSRKAEMDLHRKLQN